MWWGGEFLIKNLARGWGKDGVKGKEGGFFYST